MPIFKKLLPVLLLFGLVFLAAGCGAGKGAPAQTADGGLELTAQTLNAGSVLPGVDWGAEQTAFSQAAGLSLTQISALPFTDDLYTTSVRRADGAITAMTVEAEILPAPEGYYACFSAQPMPVTCLGVGMNAAPLAGFYQGSLNSFSLIFDDYTAQQATQLRSALEAAFGAPETDGGEVFDGVQCHWVWTLAQTRMILTYDTANGGPGVEELALHLLRRASPAPERLAALPLEVWQPDAAAQTRRISLPDPRTGDPWTVFPGVTWADPASLLEAYGGTELPGPGMTSPGLWLTLTVGETDYALAPVYEAFPDAQVWRLAVGAGAYAPEELEQLASGLEDSLIGMLGEPTADALTGAQAGLADPAAGQRFLDWDYGLLENGQALDLVRLSLVTTRSAEGVQSVELVWYRVPEYLK